MSNVIITNEELEQVVYYLEDYKSLIGVDVKDTDIVELLKSLEVALDRNMEDVLL